MKDLIARCGLDCEACEARIATINNDDALRETTARSENEPQAMKIVVFTSAGISLLL